MAAYYRTDLSEHTIEQAPSDWTERYTATDDTWLIKANAGAEGGQWLEHTVSAAAYRLLSWNAIDSDAQRDDIEVLAKFKSSAVAGNGTVLISVRASGSAGNETAYRLEWEWFAIRFQKVVNGTATTLTNLVIEWTTSDFWWVRFRVIGNTVKIRFWKEGDPEPGFWGKEYTVLPEDEIAGVGWAGPGSRVSSGTRTWDYFSVATGGNTALAPDDPDPTPSYSDPPVLFCSVDDLVNGPVFATTIPGLRLDEQYEARAWAVNKFGIEGAAFGPVAFTSAGWTELPAAPATITAAQGPGKSIRVTWSEVPAVQVLHYELQRNGVTIGKIADTEHVDQAVSYGVEYTYQVSTVDRAKNASATWTAASPITIARNIAQPDLTDSSVGSPQLIDLNVTNPKLGDSAVSTGKIADNATAVASLKSINSVLTGNGALQTAVDVTVSVSEAITTPVLVSFYTRQGYSAGATNTQFQIERDDGGGGVNLYDSGSIGSLTDLPAVGTKDTIMGPATVTYRVKWLANNTVLLDFRTLLVLGVKK